MFKLAPTSGLKTSKCDPLPARSDARAKDRLAGALFLLALGFNVFVFVRWAGQPLLDQHRFRQTQTAVSAYWLAEGAGWNHWLHYETPLFGVPWQVPFEFPLFQWAVAFAYRATGLPLDLLGRCLSALAFYACLWPLHMLARSFGFNRRCFHLAAALLLAAPVYVYWSRAFLIESTALLLSLLFLAWFRQHLVSARDHYLVLALSAGVLAALTKLTTFAAFAAAGAGLVVADFAASRAWLRPGKAIRRYLPVLLGALVGGLLLVVWMQHADALKAANLFARRLTTTRLHDWTSGTSAQRLSSILWRDTLWRRAIPEAVGSFLPFLVCGLALLRMRNRERRLLAALLVLFLVPFLAFTNLHIIHNYYQYANAVFLVLATGLSLWQLSQGASLLGFAVACLIPFVGDVYVFTRHYLPSLRERSSGSSLLQAAQLLRETTPAASVLVVVGCEWDPTLAYYARRRTVYVPPWASRDELLQFLQRPSDLAGDKPISAVVELLGGGVPVGTGVWRYFADRLVLESDVRRCQEYQCLSPRDQDSWPRIVADISLPPEPPRRSDLRSAQAEWRALPPPAWAAAPVGAPTSAGLDLIELGDEPVPSSTVPVLALPGTAMHLRGWLAAAQPPAAPPQLALRLWGPETSTLRYTWVALPPAPDGAHRLSPTSPGQCRFDLLTRLPEDLPEDTYELALWQRRGPGLAGAPLGLKLQVVQPWLEAGPEASSTAGMMDEVVGNVEEFTVNGQVLQPTKPPMVIRPGAVLRMRGWATTRTASNAPPEVFLAFRAPGIQTTRYVRAQRVWRLDVSAAFADSRFDRSGFRVRCTVPRSLPAALYQVSLVQTGEGRTAELAITPSLKVEQD